MSGTGGAPAVPVITEEDLRELDTQTVLDEPLEATDRVNAVFLHIGSVISVAATITIGVLMLVSVVLRYGFNASLELAAEAPIYLFPWLIGGGAIVAQSQMGHVSVDLLQDVVGARARKLVALLVWVLSTAILAYGAYLAIFMSQQLAGLTTVVLEWPVLGSFGAFAGTLAIMAVQALVRVWVILRTNDEALMRHTGSEGSHV